MDDWDALVAETLRSAAWGLALAAWALVATGGIVAWLVWGR